jgi:hypothetical protein
MKSGMCSGGRRLTAIFAYWFALKDEGELPLRNATAFLLSWYNSLLWGMIVTLIHILGGATIYQNGLQTLSMHSNWLAVGTLAFYFGTPKRPGARHKRRSAKKSQGSCQATRGPDPLLSLPGRLQLCNRRSTALP